MPPFVTPWTPHVLPPVSPPWTAGRPPHLCPTPVQGPITHDGHPRGHAHPPYLGPTATPTVPSCKGISRPIPTSARVPFPRAPPGTTANGSTRRPRPMRAARSTVAPSLHPQRHVPVAGFRHPPLSTGGVIRPPCIISPTFIYALVTLNMPLGRQARHFVWSFKCIPWPFLLVVQHTQIFLILRRSPIQSLFHITILHSICTDLHPNLINASWAICVKSLR